MAKSYFDRVGISIEAVVDRRAQECQGDSFWEGIALVHPDSITFEQRGQVLLAVCVANIYFTRLETELLNCGWHDIAHFYDISAAYTDRHPLSNGWCCDKLSEKDCAGILKVLRSWHDDASRAYHLQFVAWRHLRQDWSFSGAPMMPADRYLIPEVRSVLHKHERFVDVGGHRGETSMLLLRAVDFEYEQLWIFEPDLQNFQSTQHTFAALKDSERNRIHISQYALGSCASTARFFGGAGYASQLSELGDRHVNVIELDTLGIGMSFMKLHVEGSELDVLRGAKRGLLHHRPVVAATSYHNRLGLFELAQWLMDTLIDYVFLYRLHSGCGTGAVIYAIPMERCAHNFAN